MNYESNWRTNTIISYVTYESMKCSTGVPRD